MPPPRGALVALTQRRRHARDEAEALVVLGHARQACAQFAKARRNWHDAYLVFSDLGDKRAAETLALIRDPAAGTCRT